MPEPIHTACAHCGSDKIIHGVRIGQTAEVGSIGLSYKSGMIFVGTAPFVADLCDSCGTVVRLYVKSVGKEWRRD